MILAAVEAVRVFNALDIDEPETAAVDAIAGACHHPAMPIRADGEPRAELVTQFDHSGFGGKIVETVLVGHENRRF